MGKLVIKLIQSGSRLASDAIQTARQRRDSNYTAPTTPSSLPLEESDRLVLADEEIAKGLIREGRAELPASNELSIHQQYAELPADVEPSVHRDYAELPADIPITCEAQPFEVKPLTEGKSVTTFSEQRNSQQHSQLNDSGGMEHVRLPTYEESEWAPVAFSNTESSAEDRRDIHDPTPSIRTPNSGHILQRLSFPVFIPHCGLGNGTERAYAPVLNDCGISHEKFSRFLEEFNQSTLDSGIVDSITVAAGLSTDVLEIAPFLLGRMIEVAAGIAAREMLFSWHVNSFLDRANQEIFMPCGLYAVVMQFKDEVSGQQNGPFGALSQSLGKSLFVTEKIDNIQTPVRSGLATTAMFELPSTAHLASLDSDDLPKEEMTYQRDSSDDTRDGLVGKLKSLHEARQSRSSLEAHEPRHKGLLSACKDTHHHRKNDKLHITKLSGGRLGTRPGLIERAATSIRETQEAKRKERDSNTTERSGKFLQPGVPYLVIVNMPSEEGLQKSIAQLELIFQQTR